MLRHAVAAICLIIGTCLSAAAVAQGKYPERPITFIVPWGPGGGADQLARTAGKLMEAMVHVSLPVINVPGATGQTGLQKLLTGPADGYSIEVLTGDTFALFAAPNARFRLEQITLLAVMIQQPSGFFVKIDSPWKTWADVENVAKTKSLRVAVTGFGSPDDLTVNFFRGRGMKFESIPFPEPGLRYASVIGGQSDLLYEQAGDVRSFLDGNQIRPVLFFSRSAFAPYPEVPYSKSLGYDVTLPQFRVIIVRAGTDGKIVETLSGALGKVAKEPEYAAYLKQQLGEPESYVPAAESPAYMDRWLQEAKALAALTNKK
jgi:putative tricarboxylic transport membrane protein